MVAREGSLPFLETKHTKYSILHMIGVKNWAPSAHFIGISLNLTQFTHQVGTCATLDYGKFVCEQLIRDAGSEAIKLPIVYPSLLCGLILKQHTDIVKEEKVKSFLVALGMISFNYKVFQSYPATDISACPPQFVYLSLAPCLPKLPLCLRCPPS